MSASRFVANPRLKALKEEAMSEAALAGLVMASAAMKTLLSRKGTGRAYTQKGGRVHRASTAGSPPAPNFGRLRASWSLDSAGKRITPSDSVLSRVKLKPTSVGWRLSSTLRYAKIEHGYRGVAARPYIKPTLALVNPEIPQVMAVALKRAFKRRFGSGRK